MSTHMDAPAQLSDGPGKWRIDDIPIDRLISEAVVIDISYTADVETNPDATVCTRMLTWLAYIKHVPGSCPLLNVMMHLIWYKSIWLWSYNVPLN